MNKEKILELLRNTTSPEPTIREPAEENLKSVHKIIGFGPLLLEITLDQFQELHVRQSAVIYLKNNISKYWDGVPSDSGQLDPATFVIHEHDKTLIRDSIVDSIVRCGHNQLALHLSSVVNVIIKADFPHKWTGVVDKIHYYLAQTNDANSWSGALTTFYQLAKIYEYKQSKERKAFIEALKILLPATCQRLTQLLQNDPLSEQSCMLQKQILKTFHAVLQYSLPLAILTRDVFSQWMALIIEISKREVPEEVQKDVDPDDRTDLIWWKCKKWSLHLLARIFERYGSPTQVGKEYKSFAEWYINTFSFTVIQTIINILEKYAIGNYVSPRVMQQALNYLNTAILHSITWKMLKNDMMVVVEKIIFPLMCYTSEDQELWESDPREYIRMKFDIFEEYVSPVSASQNLLVSTCKKRRGMLQKTMTLVVNILNNPQADPKAKDGALHMIGSISSILLKKPMFKDQLEQMLESYIFPLFSCQHGFLRARACWVLNHFSGIDFKNPNNVVQASQSVIQCILMDQDLPVKVEAALCLQVLLHVQDKAREVAQPAVKNITLELLQIIRNTQNEDVMEVLQKVVYLYPNDIYPIAVDMVGHLAQTFHQLLQSGDGEEEERISAAMAIMGTIDTVLTMMDEQKEIMNKLEPIVLVIIMTIFEQSVAELYEEATSLLSTLTADGCSPEIWRCFQTLYIVFKRDGSDYLSDLMSPIHNYISVDPQTFLSSRDNISAIYDMCRTVLTNPNEIEEIESYAAKLIEIVILQFRDQISDCIPSFIQLAIDRLRREITLDELRTLLIQIVIATLYTNHQLLFDIFNNIEQQTQQPKYSLFDNFIKQWLKDIEHLMGLHDRKMSIIGLCTLIMLPADKRPPIVQQISDKIVPTILVLYEKLKIAYNLKLSSNSDSETDDEDDDDLDNSDDEAEVLEDDQDHVGPNAANCDDDFEDETSGVTGSMALNATGSPTDNDDCELRLSDTDEYDDEDLCSDEDCEQTALETFETVIDNAKGFVDEFKLFRDAMESVRQSDMNWYQMLLAPLDASQQKKLVEMGEYCMKKSSNP